MTLWLVTVLAPLQILLGDLHGLNTLEHQPLKIAAMEGNWETASGVPAILFAIPDEEAETNHFEIAIPKLGSLILTHEWDGVVPGLEEWAPEDRPSVPIVFTSFRIMVAIGFTMLLVALLSLYLRFRRRLFESRWFLRLCVACTPLGFIAILAGWVTTEHGRQPWVVYDLVRTADGVSPALTGGTVLSSLIAFFVAYAAIFSAGTYYLLKLIGQGPEERPAGAVKERTGTPQRPLSAAERPIEPGP
jgi:cytochrome d ubiquinol oxidase subunit I